MKNFYNFKVNNIKGLSAQEKEFRNRELDLFSKIGFPNRREEAWKFTDLNTILSKNFTNITNDYISFCLLYTSPSPRDLSTSRMPSSA